jgi:hypothetical protein
MHLVWVQSFVFAGEPIAVLVVPAYGIGGRGQAAFPLRVLMPGNEKYR